MKSLKIILPLFLLLAITGCKKGWLDINEDPNNPTVAPLNQMLTSAQVDMADNMAQGNGIGEILEVYVHRISVREYPDQYSTAGTDYSVGYCWEGLYTGPLQDLEYIIDAGTESGDLEYVGIGKILKAYTFSQIVDIWGDVPFTEANNPEIRYPVFDDDATIYPALFTLLNEAIADINNADATNLMVPGADDLIYGGDMDKWVSLAKTIKLKLYNQVRLYQNVSSEVNALISEGDLIGTGDDFMLWYNAAAAPENRHPGFADEYGGNQITHYISPWFWEILTGQNTNIFSGITDPRIPYYVYHQRGDDGNPPEYVDGPFISIYFGSIGPNRDHAGRATFSMMGLYPVGGRYDDGNGGDGNAATATGQAPYRFITYADRLFIEAELAQASVSSGNARTSLENAMTASFNMVDIVAAGNGSAQDIPTLSGTTPATDYYADILAEYDAASAVEQMEIIMTQKWIQSFGSSVDAYTDYRRTGYPVIFDPNTMPSDPPDTEPVQTQCTRDYQVSLNWNSDDIELNSNSPAQKNATTDKVFWDVD